jgi:hypothetical protein
MFSTYSKQMNGTIRQATVRSVEEANRDSAVVISGGFCSLLIFALPE